MTPTIGISCRSGTIMVYAASQLVLVFLWIGKIRLWDRVSMQEDAVERKLWRTFFVKTCWCLLLAMATTMSVFTSIGGTSESSMTRFGLQAIDHRLCSIYLHESLCQLPVSVSSTH